MFQPNIDWFCVTSVMVNRLASRWLDKQCGVYVRLFFPLWLPTVNRLGRLSFETQTEWWSNRPCKKWLEEREGFRKIEFGDLTWVGSSPFSPIHKPLRGSLSRQIPIPMILYKWFRFTVFGGGVYLQQTEHFSVQERERQETIRKIKRLYSHPSNLNTLEQHAPPHHQQLYPTPWVRYRGSPGWLLGLFITFSLRVALSCASVKVVVGHINNEGSSVVYHLLILCTGYWKLLGTLTYGDIEPEGRGFIYFK